MNAPAAEAIDLICRSRVLAALGPPARSRLAEQAVRIHVAPGQVLFERGALANRLFLVVEGSVESLLDDEIGNRTRVEVVSAPQPLDLVSALDGGTHAYSCEGGPDGAGLLVLSAAAFLAELPANPIVVRLLLAETSARLRRLVGQLSNLKLRSSVQRLAGYIVDLTQEQGGGDSVTLHSEKRLVADRLGMKPETLSRALARLEAMGLVQPADAETLRVADIAGLRKLYLAGDRNPES